MSIISPELAALIDSGPLAHVVTINPDGSPQVTVVWIGLDGDDVVSGHLLKHRKLRNIERDPRIAISLQAPIEPGVFLAEYAVLYGSGMVETEGAADLQERLGKIYVGPDFEFPGDHGRGGYVLRTRVERVAGHGPWAPDGG